MSTDYDYDKQVALLMQKKFLRNRKMKFNAALTKIALETNSLYEHAIHLTLEKPNDFHREVRNMIVYLNRYIYVALEIVKEYKKARADLMRIKHG